MGKKSKAKASPAKAKAKTGTRAKKSPGAKKKSASVKELILKKFETRTPETLYKVPRDEKYLENFSAPRFVSDEGEAARLRELLLQTFDFKSFPATGVPDKESEPAEKGAGLEKKPVHIENTVEKEDKPEEKLNGAQDTAKKAVKSDEIKKKEDAENPLPAKKQELVSKVPVNKLPMKKKGKDYMETTMKYSAAAFAVVIAIILFASFSNASKYYLKAGDSGVEVWQGSFSPTDTELLMALPGIQAPESVKSVYSRDEVYPFVFGYYIKKADALWNAPGMPDIKKMKAYLNKAISYGTRGNIRDAYSRLKKIDVIVLMSKADIFASKGSMTGFQEALSCLNKADKLEKANLLGLEASGSQGDLIKGKIEVVSNLVKAFEAKQTEASKAVDAAPEPAE